ncbi:MAG: LysR family transcriptional regulator [Oscillospiraceae bacterium]|jgi:DNA-binding transcriptional LysR family regulator|nr:LysR family transcriptional regulator [Oscillospiraceae bacterium]
MDIDLELYRVFRETAKCGAFSKAAERLFVSQSAVSQAITRLEGKIGGKLFDRAARGVTLTAEGAVLFSRIDDAIVLIENAQTKFAEMKALRAGSIRVGASDTVCGLFLLPILKKFNDRRPEIRISVTNRTTRESIELLKHAAVDIAFVNLPVEDDASLDITPVKEIHDCFVAGEKYAHLADGTMHLADLKDVPVLMLEKESNTRRRMDMFLAGLGVELRPAIELGSLALLSEFAKIGLGVAATIKEEAQGMLDRRELRELHFHEELPRRHIGLARMRRANPPFAVEAFIDQMR